MIVFLQFFIAIKGERFCILAISGRNKKSKLSSVSDQQRLERLSLGSHLFLFWLEEESYVGLVQLITPSTDLQY